MRKNLRFSVPPSTIQVVERTVNILPPGGQDWDSEGNAMFPEENTLVSFFRNGRKMELDIIKSGDWFVVAETGEVHLLEELLQKEKVPHHWF